MYLEDARKILNESKPQDVVFVGRKPWSERIITHTKLFLFGVGLFAASSLTPSGELGKDLMQKFKAQQAQVINVPMPSAGAIVQAQQQNALISQSQKSSAIVDLEKNYPGADFSQINSARDVSKAFFKSNTFIALAAEMEGFRGDLHKDPATGMNIGFGYNITKRVAQLGADTVKADLLAIGIDKDKINDIIGASQKPQAQLIKTIKHFNDQLLVERKQQSKNGNQVNNQVSAPVDPDNAVALINIEQGVALLLRTQQEYQSEARNAFIDSFDKMTASQQEVLAYAQYKTGSIDKYHATIRNAKEVFSSHHTPVFKDFCKIAKGLVFYYRQDGKGMVRDERSILIAHSFINPDNLGFQVGAPVKTPVRALMKGVAQLDSLIPKPQSADAIVINGDSPNPNNFSSVIGVTSVTPQASPVIAVENATNNSPSMPSDVTPPVEASSTPVINTSADLDSQQDSQIGQKPKM